MTPSQFEQGRGPFPWKWKETAVKVDVSDHECEFLMCLAFRN